MKWRNGIHVHPFPCFGVRRVRQELLSPMAFGSKLPRIASLKGLFCEPLLDPRFLLASAFPVPGQPWQEDWLRPGVTPGSCVSSLRVLRWPSLSIVSIHLLLSPFHAAVRCCFVPWRKPILFCSYQRRNKSAATRKNMECKHVFPGHQHASKRAWKWVLIYCMIQCLQDYQAFPTGSPTAITWLWISIITMYDGWTSKLMIKEKNKIVIMVITIVIV